MLLFLQHDSFFESFAIAFATNLGFSQFTWQFGLGEWYQSRLEFDIVTVNLTF